MSGAPRHTPSSTELTSVGQVRIVPTGEWDELLQALGGLDTYTRLAYHRVSALLDPTPSVPVLVHYDGENGGLALPLLLRPLPDGRGWDATSPYGYGGPVALSEGAAEGFGAALDTWARENGVVATFLRLHPLLGNARLVPHTAELVALGETVAWDVTAGRNLAALMHTHHRRVARKADRAGIEARVVTRPDDLGEFTELYRQTMLRRGADPFYFFSAEYWDALRRDGDELGLLLVEGRLEDELVAGLLCFSHGSWLHYHLGATSDAARLIGASNRCFQAAAEWAQSRGMTRFHLGGGLGGDSASSLFVFKHRFDPSSKPLTFHVAKFVHDRDRYRHLAGTDSTEGFFPVWRRPPSG
jgi:serine/alanine adding enzyme